MYRFLVRPKWLLFHLLCILGVITMVLLGFWQLHRLQDRQAFNDQVRAAQAQPVAALDDVLADAPDDAAWRQVTVSGTFDPAFGTVRVVNRSQDGTAGRNIVGLIDLGDGRGVVVARGFLPQNVSADPDLPTGQVVVGGTLRDADQRRTGQPSTPSTGDIPRVELDALQSRTELQLVPYWVAMTSSQPADSDLLAPIAAPTLGEGPHLSYMVQWWVFSACVVVGWVIVVRRTARDTHQPRRRKAQLPRLELPS